jgi:hypothetical protein
MNIEGKDKVTKVFEGKLKQPYPIPTGQYLVKGKEVDLPVIIGQAQFDIDGKSYSGVLAYLLNEDK